MMSLSRVKEHKIRQFAPYSILLLWWVAQAGPPPRRHMIVLDPGHSHAAAVFAQESPDISPDVHIYAPPGPDVDAFLRSLSAFNQFGEPDTLGNETIYRS